MASCWGMPTALAKSLHGASFAELEEFTGDILRRYVLQLPNADLRAITRQRLAQWRMRSAVMVAGEGDG